MLKWLHVVQGTLQLILSSEFLDLLNACKASSRAGDTDYFHSSYWHTRA